MEFHKMPLAALGIASLLLASCDVSVSHETELSVSDTQSATTFTNPILPGGYPDPSICRVGDDFYIVNSSFEFFPGLPIHHSTDLVNWRLIGHGLHRPEQASSAVNLIDVQSDGGIHAPSLRCRDDKFYLITTNVYSPPDGGDTQMVNFVLTADDPAGPWSEPHVIDGAPGIDPDLFFDDDGTVWYVGNHGPDDASYPGEGEIWLQRLDPETWSLIGERHFLWRGALKRAIWAEGPHIYKVDGRYYLLVAEGGTSFNHAVTIAVSDQLTGPYIGNDRNPILTSRHLSYDHWVNSTGHADLVELADGRWYMVALGIRGDEERRSNMGRESHLIPVQWEREPFEWKSDRPLWPVVAPDSGRVERDVPLPFVDKPQRLTPAFSDEFDESELQADWTFRRVPEPGTYSLSANPGHLRLYPSPSVPEERGRAALVGIKQTETNFEFETAMQFSSEQVGIEAGISLFQKDDHHLMATVIKADEGYRIQAILSQRGSEPETIAALAMPDYPGSLQWRLSAEQFRLEVSYRFDDASEWIVLGSIPTSSLLSRYYTGSHIGFYSTSNGSETSAFADFDWVRYRGTAVK